MSFAHGDRERDVLALDPLLFLRVDALQMQVADALVMAAEERHRIATAIGVMARVEAERHPLRVGLLEERFDLVLVFDVRLGMRVIDQLQTEAIAARSAIAMGGLDQPFPGVVIESRSAGWACP